MEQDHRKPNGQLRRQDLASVPDSLRPDAATSEAVFGSHWPDDPDLQRQYALELESWLEGMTRYRLRVERASATHGRHHLSPIAQLVAHWAKPLATTIDDYRAAFLRKKSGRAGGPPPKWLKRTAHLESGAIANIVIETILSRAALGKPMLQPALASAIGRAVEELHFVGMWEEANPALLRAYYERLQRAGATQDHRHTVLRHGFTTKVLKHANVDGDRLWSVQERAETGLALIELASDATKGRIHVDADSGRRRRQGRRIRSDQKLVTLDDETCAWIAEGLTRGELRSTSLRPMLVEPRPWRGPYDGGYCLGVGPATSVVIGEHRPAVAVRKRLAEEPGSAALIYQALDYLGRTRWRVNRGVLQVAAAARDAGLSLPGLPQALRSEVPPKPADIGTDRAAREAWRQAKTRTIEANLAHRGRVLQARMTLAEAERFADVPALYFPHHCDFRGRIYPMPAALNIQGSDLTRSLLEFGHGQPIEDEIGAGWLAAHTAKMFGQGRVAFDDRIAWTRANEALLRRIASDPLGHRQEWAATADQLWLGLAAAKEWVAFLDQGFGFITHLPCFIDGTCNGIQHFAALARDPDLAALVNLTPSETVQDIYQAVADQASAIIARKVADRDDWARRWSRLLEDSGVPRSLAKKVVMTKPYGASQKSLMDDVGETLDALDPHQVAVPRFERAKARAWLAKIMKEALSDRLASAERIMQWLKQTAAVASRHGKTEAGQAAGLHWTTPTGWPWVMAYGLKQRRNAHVRINGGRSTALVYAESATHLDATAQSDAVSANFIHALDASALVFALDAMRRGNVSGAGVIHDCVGGLATEMTAIGKAVRKGFVMLYEQHDPLWSFYMSALAQLPEEQRIALAEPPTPEHFDLNLVLRSKYFFA